MAKEYGVRLEVPKLSQCIIEKDTVIIPGSLIAHFANLNLCYELEDLEEALHYFQAVKGKQPLISTYDFPNVKKTTTKKVKAKSKVSSRKRR